MRIDISHLSCRAGGYATESLQVDAQPTHSPLTFTVGAEHRILRLSWVPLHSASDSFWRDRGFWRHSVRHAASRQTDTHNVRTASRCVITVRRLTPSFYSWSKPYVRADNSQKTKTRPHSPSRCDLAVGKRRYSAASSSQPALDGDGRQHTRWSEARCKTRAQSLSSKSSK